MRGFYSKKQKIYFLSALIIFSLLNLAAAAQQRAVTDTNPSRLGNISPRGTDMFTKYGSDIERYNFRAGSTPALNLNGAGSYPNVYNSITYRRTGNFVISTFIINRTVSLYLNDDFNTVELLDMSGKLLQKEVISGRTGRIDIPLPATVSGTVVVRVTGKGTTLVQKVLVDH